MHGITLTSAPSDWEVLQQKDKKASVTLKGTFQVHPAAIQVGVDQAERADEEEQKSFQLEGSGIGRKVTFEHVKNCFLVYYALGKDSGFTLTDRQGEVEILHIRGNRENKNHLYLEPPIIDLSIIIVEVLCIF